MADQEQARCPVCGDADSTVNLRAFRPSVDDLAAQTREAAAHVAAQPASVGVEAPLEMRGEDAVAGLAVLAIRWALRKVFLDPFRYRALPTLARKTGEVQRNMSSALDRHPDLWLCPRDEVVFRAGRPNTAPARAAMRWLARGEEVKLATALGES